MIQSIKPSTAKEISDGGGEFPVILPSMLYEWLGLVLVNTMLLRTEKYRVAKAIGENSALFIDGLLSCLAHSELDASKLDQVRTALTDAMAVKSERMVVCRCGCRFPLNSFGSGFIGAVGHCYMCDVRNRVQSTELDCPDWGPWHVSTGPDGYVALQSETGAEDAALKVSGNFGGDLERQAYAERMANWLNQQISREGEPVVRVPVDRCNHVSMKLLELQSGSCTCLTKSPKLDDHAEACRYRQLGELRLEIDAWIAG